MASRTLEKRYGVSGSDTDCALRSADPGSQRLQAYVYKPFTDFMRENPQRARDMDFE